MGAGIDTEGHGSNHRKSRTAFAAAVLTFIVGSFISFGGVGYAASSSSHAIHNVTHVAKSQTSAKNQYNHPKTVTKPKPQTGSIKGSVTKSAGKPPTTRPQGSLPFTGLSLAFTAGLGFLLVIVGLGLRRIERASAER
jgi:cytochrome c biogenesis protein CcdA